MPIFRIGDNTADDIAGFDAIQISRGPEADVNQSFSGDLSLRNGGPDPAQRRDGVGAPRGLASLRGNGYTVVSVTATYTSQGGFDEPWLLYILHESWIHDEVTWNSRSDGVAWTNAGAAPPTSSDSTSVATALHATNDGDPMTFVYDSAGVAAIQAVLDGSGDVAGHRLEATEDGSQAAYKQTGADGFRPYLTIEVEAAGGPITVETGLATETDTVNSVTHSKRKTVGQTTETDAAQTARKLKRKTTGLTTEADTPQVVTKRKAKATGLTAESDTAQTTAKRKLKVTGQPTETDTAQTTAKRKLKATGLTMETETTFAATVIQEGQPIVITTGLTTETDTALAAGKLKAVDLEEATEDDLGLAATVVQESSTVVETGLTTETDTALSVLHRKAKITGLTTETDEALAAASTGTVLTGLPTETDQAQPIGKRKVKATGLATESSAALTATATKRKTVLTGLTTETDTALSVSHKKTKRCGTAFELDRALPIEDSGSGEDTTEVWREKRRRMWRSNHEIRQLKGSGELPEWFTDSRRPERLG